MKLSTIAAVFKKVSSLIGGPSTSIGGGKLPLAPLALALQKTYTSLQLLGKIHPAACSSRVKDSLITLIGRLPTTHCTQTEFRNHDYQNNQKEYKFAILNVGFRYFLHPILKHAATIQNDAGTIFESLFKFLYLGKFSHEPNL